MNLQEAIKTKRRFKRKEWTVYYENPGVIHRFSLEDLLAEDWMIEPQIIALTKDQFLDALDQCGATSSRVIQQRILKLLGFK